MLHPQSSSCCCTTDPYDRRRMSNHVENARQQWPRFGASSTLYGCTRRMWETNTCSRLGTLAKVSLLITVSSLLFKYLVVLMNPRCDVRGTVNKQVMDDPQFFQHNKTQKRSRTNCLKFVERQITTNTSAVRPKGSSS